ncbi:redoxin domain-containing protein [Ferruginibacter sp. SUN106]|uniref:redoxin domain-containing protein n=1 Tax=Ferruginibacter sp. SUN106 TaxID=2978348 RepID=UPI003D36AA33
MIKKIAFVIAFFCFVFTAAAQPIPKLKMADVVRSFSTKSDSIFVINFWATFCKPCVGEIPGFIKIADKYKKDKVKLLLVSLDLPSFYPKRIATFAAKNNFTTNIAWLNETDADYFCPMIDTAWSGAIPATIMVNTRTGYKKFFEGELNGEQFEAELKKAIGENTTSVTNPKFYMPMNNAKVLEYENENPFAYHGNDAMVTFRSKDSTVFAVTEGKVSTIATIDDIKVVIVEKDSMFYTYSNLKSVLVKRGDKIKADQMIGYAAFDLDSIMPTVDFYMNDPKKSIALSKNNFKPRKNSNGAKDHSFDPMKEPE